MQAWIVFMAMALTGGAADCPVVATHGPDVEAVSRRERDGARVNVDGWRIDDARDFFTSDYFSLQPDGTVRRLDAVLATFKDGRGAGWARSFDIADLDVRVYHCTSAVATGIAQVRALAAPADAQPWRIRYLNVWRREDGRWRNAANQFVRVVETPARP